VSVRIFFTVPRDRTPQQFPNSRRSRRKALAEPKVVNSALVILRHIHLKAIGATFLIHRPNLFIDQTSGFLRRDPSEDVPAPM
jgi:hypothetical protein